MYHPQFLLDLNEELIVDNFAGGGGASTGIEIALGRHVDHAINHDRHALGMHRINHPQTIHHCEDVFDVDPATVCEGRPVGLAHFSPDCKHHSKAKGGKPVDKKIRGLVVVMLRWAKYGARVMTMENVEEIVKWGPLKLMFKKGSWDWYPDPAHIGRTWKAFLACLSTGIDPAHPDLPEILEVLAGTVTKEECVRGFGYKFEAREIRACDFGSPTIRKRLFMVARRDGRAIIWPAATHFEARHGEHTDRTWRTIAECIDWSLHCPSIFLTSEQAREQGFNCRRPLRPATLRRIAMGIERYVLRAKRPFLVKLTHQGGDRVEGVDEPGKTITGANRGETGLVAPSVQRFNGDHAGRADGANRNLPLTGPITTQDTSNRFGLTEASLAAPFITEHANASSQRNMPADEPGRTICGEVKGGHLAAVSAHLMVNTTDHPGGAATSPGATQTTGQQQALIACTGVQTGYGEADGQAPRILDIEQPGNTAVGSVKQAAVSAVLFGAGGPAYGGEPKAVTVPMNAQTTTEHKALASATLIHTAHGEEDRAGNKRRGRGAHSVEETMPTLLTTTDGAVAVVKLSGEASTHPGQSAEYPAPAVRAEGQHVAIAAASIVRHFGESVGQDASNPAPTVMPEGGGKTGMSMAYLAQHNAGNNVNPGHAAEDPASTISTKGSQQQVVAASVATYFGTERDGQHPDESARTVSTKPRKALVESTGVAPMTAAQIESARRVAAFLREHGVKIDGEFATVAGFVIIDIGMRMLTPRELFRAQGFPENYTISEATIVLPSGEARVVTLTKEQQIRMCGNSVCPQPYCEIVRANVPELAAVNRNKIKRKRNLALVS